MTPMADETAHPEVGGQAGPRLGRPRWGWELTLVAALALGQSAVYALVRLIDMSTRGPLTEAQARLNVEASTRPWFDLVYQLLGIGFALVPVLLVLFLLNRDRVWAATGADLGGGPVALRGLGFRGSRKADAVRGEGAADVRPALQRIGFDLRRRGWDLGTGTLLFLVIGIGTLGVYATGRALGLTAEILPNNLQAYWWTVPVLLLSAAKNGILEEVLLLGYGVDRLEKLRLGPWAIIIGLALFRASYHLYQGVGPFVGNVLMGLLFGWLYLRWRRVMPFVVAHTLIDAVGFLAPGILAAVDPL